jgi:hypothetical protein
MKASRAFPLVVFTDECQFVHSNERRKACVWLFPPNGASAFCVPDSDRSAIKVIVLGTIHPRTGVRAGPQRYVCAGHRCSAGGVSAWYGRTMDGASAHITVVMEWSHSLWRHCAHSWAPIGALRVCIWPGPLSTHTRTWLVPVTCIAVRMPVCVIVTTDA